MEWAHAMAPGAQILVVEASSASFTNLTTAAEFAAHEPGVSVVSMSWGWKDFSGEAQSDGDFTTPSGHTPVTFVAASGDSGTVSYPAASPNVLSVGGTNLTLDSNNNILSETAWSGSGGGISQNERLPSYQAGVVPSGTVNRANPDVAYNAGVSYSIYDSYNNGTLTPWSNVIGTSAGAPQWSALIAIADQGRNIHGLPALDGPSQTLPMLYAAVGVDFNDITSGSNGSYSAKAGYDMVTGLGSPKADMVAYSLVGQNFELHNGVLTVDGDQLSANAADSVQVGLTASGGVQITLDGEIAYFSPGAVSSIDIFTKGGDNSVDIEATAFGVPVTVNLLGGSGTVNISPSGENLGSIASDVTVVGGASSDVLNIYDQNDPYESTYSITSTSVTSSESSTKISYSMIGTLNLYGGSAPDTFGTPADTYNIESTASQTATFIEGGTCNNTFNVTPTGKNLDSIQGGLTIWGHAPDAQGNDTLNVRDQDNTANGSYSVTSSTVTRTGSATISYASMETANVYGGSSNNTYNIESTPSGTAVGVEGGNGNDTFNISPTAKSLANIQGDLTVVGGAGSNTVNVDDQNNAASDTYSLTSTTVSRTGAATISYGSNVADMNLYGGSGNDTYNIESTASGTAAQVEGGKGNDTFNVSPTARSLANIQGALTVVGGAGSNTVNVDDQNNAASDTYSLTSTTVSRTGAATISYGSNVADMNLYGGSGNDTYNIESTASGTAAQVEGGKGYDTFNVSPTAENLASIQGALTVVGGAGSNTVNVDDQNNAASDTYSLTSTTVSRTGAATISYGSNVADMNLYGGSGNDTYNIESTASGTAAQVEGGKGNDTFNVSPTAANLDNIKGNLAVLGGAGTNTLNIHDDDLAANDDLLADLLNRLAHRRGHDQLRLQCGRHEPLRRQRQRHLQYRRARRPAPPWGSQGARATTRSMSARPPRAWQTSKVT